MATGEGEQQQVAVGEGDSGVTVSHNAEDGTHDVTIGGGSSGCCSGSDTVIVVEDDDDEDEENAEPVDSEPAQAEPVDAEPEA